MTDEKIKLSKYNNIYEDIENSTIPFFMIPNIIIISSKDKSIIKVMSMKIYIFRLIFE